MEIIKITQIENFSFVTRPANAAKGECKGYGETEELHE